MIGKIAGILEAKASDWVLIDTGGVGYVVTVSEKTLAQMPARGQRVGLFTELVVREDLLQLIGFTSLAEKEWYRLLVSVQGVGAKAALAILAALDVGGTARAIMLNDVAAVRAAQGVGPKLAQRIVNELQEKAAALMASLDAEAAPAMVSGPEAAGAGMAAPLVEVETATEEPQIADGNAQAEAISALVNLGYGRSDAAMAVARAAESESEMQAMIRKALQLLAPGGQGG